jgi:general secretion pathway protein K
MRGEGREGFILISVLGALIVLGGLVAAVAYLTRTAVVGAASTREALVTDALLNSGVELAGYELFSLRRPASLVNGQRIRLNDGVVTLYTASEAGKIDLNGSPPELLAALWASIGAPGMTPETFAARVVDYRDLDDEPSKNGGAETPQYVAAGPNRLPANALFERVDELQNVLDVTPAQVRLLAPMLTVHNPSGKVAALEASAATLRAIPNGARALPQLQALKEARNGQNGDNQESALQRLLGDSAEFVTLESEPTAFTVRVEVERNGSRRTVELILTASRAADALYFVTDRVERPSR